jgi:hypothetical protein
MKQTKTTASIEKRSGRAEARTPAVMRSVSPGRKNPKKRPDSAKMIAARPTSPIVMRSC